MRSSHHRNHHARRLLCLTALACFVAGGTAYACTRKAAVPQLPELPAESLALPAENGAQPVSYTHLDVYKRQMLGYCARYCCTTARLLA